MRTAPRDPSPPLFLQEYHSRGVIFNFVQEHHSKRFSTYDHSGGRLPVCVDSKVVRTTHEACSGRTARMTAGLLQEYNSKALTFIVMQEHHSKWLRDGAFGRGWRAIHFYPLLAFPGDACTSLGATGQKAPGPGRPGLQEPQRAAR